MRPTEFTITRTFVASDEELAEAARRIAAVWPIVAEWQLERLYRSADPQRVSSDRDGRIRLLICG